MGLTKQIKDNIRRQYHYVCQRCGTYFPKSNVEQLTIHHLDKKPYCRKCHDRVESQSGMWKQARRLKTKGWILNRRRTRM